MQQRLTNLVSVPALMVWVLLALVLLPSTVAAQDLCRDGKLVLDSNTSSIRNLGSCVSYLEDPGQSMTFREVLALEPGAFTRHEGGVLNFGYT